MVKHSKNEEYTITITDIGTNGEGIGHLNDGYTLFVMGALPGDEILVRIVKAQKNYGYGKLINIITPSPDRIAPICPVSNRCGGCQISELSYDAQLAYKENKVRELLSRVGGFSEETIAQVFHPIEGMTEAPIHFRNKSQFPVGCDNDGHIITGFYAIHSHRIVPTSSCLIGSCTDSVILSCIQNYMEEYHIPAYDETTHSGLVRHVLIRTGYHTGEIMVCLVINGKGLPRANTLCDMLTSLNLRDSLDNPLRIVSICTSSNTADTNVIMGNSYEVIYGLPYLTDKIGDLSFRISPLSFFQINSVQTEKLYNKALSYAALTGNETVWDLYCGIGTISLFLARSAKHVYGVEIVPQAIANARENAEINSIDNVTFYVGEAEKVLPDFYNKASSKSDSSDTSKDALHPDVIVVDPPRKGCDQACLNTMLEMSPARIVYVSCDPATLARDLKYLCANNHYTLDAVTPVDMFPNSVHVETVCLISRKAPV